MSTSLHTNANFKFKRHLAAFRALRERVRFYPVMGGFDDAALGKADMLNEPSSPPSVPSSTAPEE
ncbi:MAG: hypothetical protein ACREK6_11825 [Candidatus Rokuibacteriota bacterium]